MPFCFHGILWRKRVRGSLHLHFIISPIGRPLFEILNLRFKDFGYFSVGVRKLSASLANGARAGTWRIEARCGGGSARVELTVGVGAGNTAPAAPAAEQHYVELRFADSMRRRYKPGLPFVGRVSTIMQQRHTSCKIKLGRDQLQYITKKYTGLVRNKRNSQMTI